MSNYIKMYRARDGITQKQLADFLGISRQTLLNVETGKHIPSIELALRLSQCFNVTVEQLFSLETNNK